MERQLGTKSKGQKGGRSRNPPFRTYGAIDLGSNNCRLLIARPARNEGFRVIEAFSRIVRLGEGVSKTGRLSDSAMDRTVEALKVCADKMRRRRVTHLRAVATEACRRSENAEHFVERVAAETGIDLEVITNGEEVRLAADGCATLLEPSVPNALIFDIGGGSTEVSWLRVRESEGAGRPEVDVADWCSLPFGVVNFSERFGGVEVSRSTYETMRQEVREAASVFESKIALKALSGSGGLQLLGTSGTVTTLVGIHLNLPYYQRDKVDGFSLEFAAMRAISSRISQMSFEERAAEACIGQERADLVIAGCAILEGLCDLWPAQRLVVADRGLREGILRFISMNAQLPSAGVNGWHLCGRMRK